VGNDRLRTAIQDAGLQPQQLADQLQVDIKTVQRWLAGRTPYPRHRHQIARALGVEKDELWPGLAVEATAAEDAPEHGHAVTAYASGDDPDAPDWRSMLEAASDRIGLLDFTLADITEDPTAVDLLAAKARAGCHIRVLISDPDSAHLTITQAERQADHRLTQRPGMADDVHRSLDLFRQLHATDRIEIRTFVAPRYNSIIRADDEMLVAPHLWGVTTTDAPVLHVVRTADGSVFDRFADHYDAIWNHAATPLS
jgi:lambda repressor-like predicted transcriptional regulator/transposase